MKKIFAIALALVMVLSMASAFAMTCNTNYDWNCATTTYDCGKAKIEVVPFVRSNTACAGEADFVQSSCAAAVVGERVYFAYKLTVDANLNEEWYKTAKLSFTYKNLCTDVGLTAVQADNTANLPAYKDASNDGKGSTYWLTTAGWVKDDDFSASTVFSLWAKKNDVQICAKLTAVNEFKGAEIGGYTVRYNAKDKTLTFTKKGDVAVVHLDGDDKVKTIDVTLDGKATVYFVADNGTAFVASNGDLFGYSCNEGAFLKGIVDFFKFNFGTCMTAKAINANFGWDDEIKSCFTWSKNGTSVVDPECKIEIPKTGDVSVVAYAVMALVAAAGAMGLKK